jgi:branched-chain amino acid transport system substrate-binding protein
MSINRRTLIAAGLSGLELGPLNTFAQKSKAPIKIGSSLALTGPLAATAQIHKLVGEIYVEKLNRQGGLLGRAVEWVLKDDQSRADLARTQYEQLLTSDNVDLLIGPYATGNIISAMGVAQRFSKILVHHTFGIPSLAKYDMQFPAWHLGPQPEKDTPNLVFNTLASSNKPPKTVAIVTSKFPSVHFIALGAREIAKQRGVKEVLFLEWEFGNLDFNAIASRIKEAAPDFLWAGAIGLEGTQLIQAMSKIDFKPRHSFYHVPAPGPMLKEPMANGALSTTVFEEHAPFTNNPVAAQFVQTYHEKASKANFSETAVDTQAAVSFTAWQIIEAAVNATQSLDDKLMAAWLKANAVDTVQGKVRFNGVNNYGDDLSKIKQIKNGKWPVVWPKEWAAPNESLTPV